MNNVELLLQSIDAELTKWQAAHRAIKEIFKLTPKSYHHGKPIKKRHLSKAGRAAIVKAAKARWAKVKAANKAKKK